MTVADAKQRFSGRVADYLRCRPGYPAGVLEILRSECALAPEHIVADIGSGTGLLCELFLRNGNRVIGVEPNAEMRRAGEDFLSQYSGFSSVPAAAEATTLPASSVDFVAAAQSFHWFDHRAARAEFARILRPSGWAVVIWNVRDTCGSSFSREYEDFLLRFGTDYLCVMHDRPATREALAGLFAAGAPVMRELPHVQEFDFSGLAGRVRSSSYMPPPEHPRFAEMMDSLRAIYCAHEENGRVAMRYTTRIYFGRLDRSGIQA